MARRKPKKTKASKRAVKKPAKPVRQPKKKTGKKVRAQALRAKPVTGLPLELKKAALKVLKDRQAEEIVAIDLASKSSVADFLIIASGRASRQLAAIADYLREAFMKCGARDIRVEGRAAANWVLVDAGDVIVHLFRPEVRRFYDLEGKFSAQGEDIDDSALMLE